MARDMGDNDYYQGGLTFPIKWMSPESINKRKFSVKSDVWAFGVLIWEVMTFGDPPFPNMAFMEVMNHVCNCNGHLEIPSLCPPELAIQLEKQNKLY